jgi:hypothetical protein
MGAMSRRKSTARALDVLKTKAGAP